MEVGLKLLLIIGIVFLIQYFKYKAPHFSMHLFKGAFYTMGVNSSYLKNKCKHTSKDIQEYKQKQKMILWVVSAISIVLLVLYLLLIIIIFFK